jgi:hypothetical protein
MMHPDNLSDLYDAIATWQQATRGYGYICLRSTTPRATTCTSTTTG